MTGERIAKMNPEAVNEAKVYTGKVEYYDGQNNELVTMDGESFVEVGKWTSKEAENTPEDFDCTYYAALLLGYGLNMDWWCIGDGGDRKYLIYKGKDAKNRPVPFTRKEAKQVAEKINTTLAKSKKIKRKHKKSK